MSRIALCLLLGGCTSIHVEVLPVVNSQTDAVSCCVAFYQIDKTTDGSITVQNSATKGVSAKLGAKWKF